jgi:putative oxidoreductase
MKNNQFLLSIMITSLILLFTYTAVSKLHDLADFERQLRNQVIPKWSVKPLLWLLPLVELAVVAMLLSKPFRLAGLWASCFLMFVFSIYMGLVVLNVFDRVPCSCGGVLRNMGFTTHFIFNLTFLFFSIASVRIQNSLDADSAFEKI